MKTITKMELKPGMILGEPVIDKGRILFDMNTKVDEHMIQLLNRHDILCVTIKEDVDLATTHYEKIRFNENFKAFEKTYNVLLSQYKAEMKLFLYTNVKPADEVLLGIYNELYGYISSGAVLLDYLYNMMPNEDELTFSHSLNVALLAGAFADWLAMSEEDKKTLILCGFYYDIGKLRLPYDILWKPGKLTAEEYELVKNHTIIGYMMVRGLDLNEHVKNSVIMHHERLDGSGYPYHISGANIDIFARYIAIADAYIAMASPRAHRSAFTPLQILGNFETSLIKYDVELLLPLMKRIADAQIGTTVQLSDDSVWNVMIIHPNKFSRPILRNEKDEFLDLFSRTDLEIVKNL